MTAPARAQHTGVSSMTTVTLEDSDMTEETPDMSRAESNLREGSLFDLSRL